MVPGSVRSAALLGAALAAMVVCTGAASAAPTYQVLYSFTGAGDGARPQGTLAVDAGGNVYGTAPAGGLSGLGAAYRVAPDGSVTVLHQFKGGRDGATPMAGLVAKGGALYGTTLYGGLANGGTVFRLKPGGGRIKILHSFGLGEDGFNPVAGVSFDAAGNLYGTTGLGGGATACGCGTVYKLAPDGGEAVLHAFTSGNDGAHPQGGVTPDGAGNLFGTTANGGAHDDGIVFALAPDGSESVLHVFSGGGAADPGAGVVRDAQGNLYGTTQESGNGFTGAIFEVKANGRTVTLHAMAGSDGYVPTSGNLVRDAHGNLYGTAMMGGTTDCGQGSGCGTVFELARDGTFSLLHSFGGGTDGYVPQGGLVMDSHGNLYGTTAFGGTFGYGTIYKISN
jgi:uncharacterized repeat protein (TIGR03803 family)